LKRRDPYSQPLGLGRGTVSRKGYFRYLRDGNLYTNFPRQVPK